uniref:IS1634 family transposase n=1 Tax=Tessaracoccus timonensis TaxID=2161816 RepID=UPI000D54C7D4|nr:IS1634 family transposase [Tessaracoccus timonensis]
MVKQGRRNKLVEHVGSAHNEQELAALEAEARRKMVPQTQDVLPLDPVAARAGRPTVVSQRSQLLWDVLATAYKVLGFDQLKDAAFQQLVLGRIIEPTSKADTIRVLDELGIEHVSRRTLFASLARARERDYRTQIASACFDHSHARGGLSLVLYDVTTLYFEAEKEDQLRKVGYSKERRVDPQIVVGLLVDRCGFPLQIGCFEGNKAETLTLLPIIERFQDLHGLADLVVVADAGMLSAMNLTGLEDAGLQFIVGSRITKAPYDLADHFARHGDAFSDGQIIETSTTMGRDKQRRRMVYQYSRQRFVRDNKTLNQQRNRALSIIEGATRPKKARFLKTTGQATSFDHNAYDKAVSLAGLKGYVTNIPTNQMTGAQVIAAYHDLWRVEQSFRMSKSDLDARPIFHHTRDAIEAHLDIVFAALAIARYLQDQTGWSIKRLVRTLRPLREVTINIAGHELTAEPTIDPNTQNIITKILGH